jgi:small-conductance mechanosensitive channel
LSALAERNGRAVAEVAASVDRAGVSRAELTAASNELEPIRAALHAVAANNESRQSPQSAAAVQRASLLALEADRLAGRIAELRGELSGTSPWMPSASVLSPSLWLGAAAALPTALERLVGQGRFWIAAVHDGGGPWRGTAVLLVLTVLYFVIGIAWLWWRQRIIAAGKGDAYFAKTLSSLRGFLRIALTLPIAVIIVGEALEVHMFEISRSVYIGTVVAAFGQAVAFAVLAPEARWRRLIGADDRTARVLALDLSAAAISLGWFFILLGMCRAVAAPAVLSTAIDMLFVIVVAGIGLHALLWTRPAAGGQRAWRWHHASAVRVAGWACLALMVLALVAGYGALAARFAAFLVSLVAAIGAIYLLYTVGKVLYVDRYAPNGPREAALAGNFGLGEGWLWLGEGLTTGAIVMGIALAAFVLIVRP